MTYESSAGDHNMTTTVRVTAHNYPCRVTVRDTCRVEGPSNVTETVTTRNHVILDGVTFESHVTDTRSIHVAEFQNQTPQNQTPQNQTPQNQTAHTQTAHTQTAHTQTAHNDNNQPSEFDVDPYISPRAG